ncbi:NIPA-like protein 2 isoform X2 [Microcaecilia unicolor]|uniref:NIPA-like protein 2 isoform X2 n=1 Tax=Microcaecilia unicolor TaxID=1415580 RepID=A0A6P7Z0Z0_9AMPH|nr:NIPA-like protein 2 isoform X2 [Microcaecilia unicolor]
MVLLLDNETYIATSGVWKPEDKNNLLGVLLAILGNFLISISLNLQKYAHLRLAYRADQRTYIKSKLWWCGILLMGIGELGNFAAYGFAPVILIAPLGCTSVIGSSVISLLFLQETLRASDLIGGTVAVTGTYLLVTFSTNATEELTGVKIQQYVVRWEFLLYLILEIIIFCVLLYFYKIKDKKHIVIVLMLVALLASATVISVKAVSSLLVVTVKGKMQLTYPIFYAMLVVMISSCIFQVKFLSQARQLYSSTEVLPINFVFFTTSAIIAGIAFYDEFHGLSFLNVLMFLFGSLLSFLGVFLITRNREQQDLQLSYINFGQVPGKKLTSTIQPNSFSYGTLQTEDNSVNSQCKERKTV